MKLHRESEVEPLLRELLALGETAEGMESYLPSIRNNLASVLQKRGAHDESEPLFRQVYARPASSQSRAHACPCATYNLLPHACACAT